MLTVAFERKDREHDILAIAKFLYLMTTTTK